MSKSRSKGRVERNRLGVIHRRIEFLEERITEAKKEGQHRGFDIQEVVALRWVLEKADLPVPIRPEE